MPAPITVSGEHVDFSPRVFSTNAVTGSPAAASETIIATVTLAGDLAVVSGVQLEGGFSITIGTSGVSCLIRLRQTDTSGTVIFATGALTVVAGNLFAFGVQGFDTSPLLPTPGKKYVMTATIGSGAATSTVSAVSLIASVF